MRFIQKSFSRKLIFFYVGIFILVFSLVSFFVSQGIKKEGLSSLKEDMIVQSRLINRIILPEMEAGKTREEIQKITADLGSDVEARVTVIGPDGLVYGDSERTWDELMGMDNHGKRPEIFRAIRGEVSSSIRYSNTLKMDMLYVAVPMSSGGKVTGVLRTALPLTQVAEVLRLAQHPIRMGFVFGITLILLLGIILGRYLTQQIGQMTRVALRFAHGDFSEKIRIQDDAELGILANAMNHMAVSLKQYISEIEGEKNKASAILENMVEGVIAVDRDQNILMVNPSVKSILNLGDKKALGKNLIEVVPDHKVVTIMEKAIEHQGIITEEIQITHFEGQIIKVNAVGVGKSKNEIAGILVLYDVTQIRKLERVRREFVANVSHELRTPLTSIKGFTETLLQGSCQDKTKCENFLKIMQEDSDRLGRLIDDLMELSKIESKQISLQKESVPLSETIDKVTEQFARRIAEKKISVQNKIPQSSHLCVAADPDKLCQILINLTDNAIKFNREGGAIVFDAETTGSLIRVNVRDAGCGIPKDALPRIFERFFRVDKARSRELGGTGLGLSIVKHIAEIHGGRVDCQSEVGAGSVFSFSLPKASA